MILRLEHLVRAYTVGLCLLTIIVVGLATGGCSSAPVAPPSQATQEPEEKEQAWLPFVVSEPGGRILVSYLQGRGGENYRFLFNRSLDGGLTWLPQPVELDSQPPQRSRIGFHQIETPGDGRVSVTWSIEQKEEAFWRTREIRNRQSSDWGTTWTGEVLRWPFLKPGHYPSPVTGRDGAVYLLWMDGPANSAVPRFIRTTDSGMTWAPQPLALPGTASFQRAYKEERGKNLSDIRGGAWPVLAVTPRGTLYSIWQEDTAKGSDVLFNRSQDGGITWLDSSPQLNTPPPGPAHTSRIPTVAVKEDGQIYVVWEDFRHNTTDLYFNRSLDGGVTWLPEDIWMTQVRPQMAAASSPHLSADRSGHLYLLWTDIREAPYSLYFSRSLDKGATWLTNAIRLDRHAPDEITQGPGLAHDDSGHVYAAWAQGSVKQVTVRFRRSDDFGATWQETEQILDSGQGKGGPRVPRLSADGKGGVSVVWSSDRTGRYQLYLNRSTDHGKTWLPHDIKITGRTPKRASGS